VDEHVIHAGLAEARHLDAELGVDRVTDLHPPLGDALGVLPSHRHAEVVRLNDGEAVARAYRDVDRNLAHTVHFDGLLRQGDEGGVHRRVTSRTRSPSERAIVCTAPASVSISTAVSAPVRGTSPVSTATVATPIRPSPRET
jgi:hypothetical protein